MTVTPELFVDFARCKLAADGSDAYITGAVHQARQSVDPFWYAGCFTTPYAPPTSEVIFARWPRAEVLARPDELLRWVTAHWAGLPISGARHVNGMGPAKLTATLVGYARWLDAGGVEALPTASAPAAFTQLLRGVPNHGRYTGMKLYETLRRLGAPVPPLDDLHPRGGRAPRRGLALIFPGHDHRSDRPPALAEANALADELRRAIPTSWFNVEVLLCNFHQAADGRFYPGYALDKELERWHKIQLMFPGAGCETLRARPALYPAAHLGELRDWASVRDPLRRVLRDHGYPWSDLRYDYGATTDLANPVRWATAGVLTPLVGAGEA